MRKKLSPFSLDHSEGINLTPLIDVVFVVLLCFIIIAPLTQLDHITLAQGGKQENRIDHPTKLVTIRIYEDNTIWVNGVMTEQEHLLSTLQKAQQNSPEATPQLFPDKRALFETYQLVKNSVEEAGFATMDVMLKAK